MLHVCIVRPEESEPKVRLYGGNCLTNAFRVLIKGAHMHAIDQDRTQNGSVRLRKVRLHSACNQGN